jgi:hypothetical protein
MRIYWYDKVLSDDETRIRENDLNTQTFWKLLLLTSVVIVTLGLIALGNIDTDIRGDGIQNKPQSTQIFNNAIKNIIIIAISGMIAIYSWYKLRTH